MLVLFETAAGYALFKLLDEKKLAKSENLYHDFESPEAANKVVKLMHFQKFIDTTEALAATTAAVEGKVSSSLKKMLKKQMGSKVHDQLLVADSKLGSAIKEKLSVTCLSNSAVLELMRCIRSQLDGLLVGLPKKEMAAMSLGLAHSLSRYKLKFSPDKVDTMIIQAVCLLDDLDKELNNYIMRCREWYGWHFPELGKIITDNVSFVKTINLIGTRDNASSTDLSDILPEEVEEKVREAAEISMGTEISDDDVQNIRNLCNQVIDISAYRAQLYDYLRTRMMAMAPNLSVLVGDLVGARLISHAGSLINLAKHPASTVQILGAEKALFRALKTKKDTPKYGLIYHSQLVGQASIKNKGKMSRMLAAKASLATRVDALGEDGTIDLGAEHKVKLEARLRLLEEGNLRRLSGTAKAKGKLEKYHATSEVHTYNIGADSTLPTSSKRKLDEMASPLIQELDNNNKHADQPKKKKIKVEVKEEPVEEASEEISKKKKKKIKSESGQEMGEALQDEPGSAKKKKIKDEVAEPQEEPVHENGSSKKKKKKDRELDYSASNIEEEDGSVEKKKKKKKKKKTQS